eukprot:GFUD01017662.1.p1 GENE.GFUD01017662.1~~GFUD01017662.1.p1  ORF type:complete len:421 (-),score=98.59 GFUD01017662.1:52-1314(-)
MDINSEAEEEVKALKRELDDQKKVMDSYKAKINEQDEHQQELKSLKLKLEEADKEVKALKQEMDEEKKVSDSYRTKINEQRRYWMNEQNEHEQELKSLKLKLEEAEEEAKALKQELDEQKKALDSYEAKINEQNENQQELKSLKLKLEELDTTKCKMNEQEHLIQQLKDQIECPVCLDIPRSGPVPVCPNGNLVCKKCKKDSCPTCRCVMGNGKSLLATTILENIEHNCKFEDCNEQFPLKDVEEHEKVCPSRIVSCPDFDCTERVPLAKLVQHLIKSSECCVEDAAPCVALQGWKRRNYSFGTKSVSGERIRWPMHIYAYSGETFAVFPVKLEGQYYAVIVMFASEAKCLEYKFELIVHDRNSEALDSLTAVRFQGNPLSIDLKKEGLRFYGIYGKLMSKILENSSMFSLSFKISKLNS